MQRSVHSRTASPAANASPRSQSPWPVRPSGGKILSGNGIGAGRGRASHVDAVSDALSEYAPQPTLSLPACGTEHLDDASIISTAVCCIQRSPSFIVPRICVRSGSEQRVDVLGIAIEGRMMQRGSASIVPCVRVCTFGQNVIKAVRPHIEGREVYRRNACVNVSGSISLPPRCPSRAEKQHRL